MLLAEGLKHIAVFIIRLNRNFILQLKSLAKKLPMFSLIRNLANFLQTQVHLTKSDLEMFNDILVFLIILFNVLGKRQMLTDLSLSLLQ